MIDWNRPVEINEIPPRSVQVWSLHGPNNHYPMEIYMRKIGDNHLKAN